jgi:hypothetical protein
MIINHAPGTIVEIKTSQSQLTSVGRRKFTLRIFLISANSFLGDLIQAIRNIVISGIVCVIGGCALPDTVVEPRSDTLNRSFTDYRNAATLLNIIRASQNEPMNFVVITGATGHDTLTGNQGLPAFVLGPHTAPTATSPVAARNFLFGPNTLQESFANDFNISALDDPSSYAALMTPLDPAMLGFFMGRQWQASVLLPLVISEIRMIDAQGQVYAFYTQQNVQQISFIFCTPAVGSSYENSHYTNCDYNLTTFEPDPDKPDKPREPETAWKIAECRAHRAFCVLPSTILITYLTATGFRFQVPRE